MPKRSERHNLLKDLDSVIEMQVINLPDSDEEDEEATADLELAILLYEDVQSIRTLFYSQPIPKDKRLKELFWRYPDATFRQIARMDKRSFVKLADLIQDHPVFESKSLHKQEEPFYQLLVVLSRLGCNGNGAAIGWFSRMAGVSHGTVCKYTDRVFTALLSLHNRAISWPSEHERREISRRFATKYGLPGAVGIVDGTHIVLAQKPHIDGEVYFSRKKQYSINLQLVCDEKKRVIFYQTGWPGSVSDSTVFDESHLCKDPDRFFSLREFLLADAGFALKHFMCTPYKRPLSLIPHHELFNKLFSSARVLIEHLNGILKARFSSLRGIRTQVKELKDFDKVNKWIVVCLILHNLMVEFNDEEWTNDEEEEEEDREEGEEEREVGNNNVNGRQLRLNVENTLLAWYYRRNQV
jgi:hypothetical protein